MITANLSETGSCVMPIHKIGKAYLVWVLCTQVIPPSNSKERPHALLPMAKSPCRTPNRSDNSWLEDLPQSPRASQEFAGINVPPEAGHSHGIASESNGTGSLSTVNLEIYASRAVAIEEPKVPFSEAVDLVELQGHVHASASIVSHSKLQSQAVGGSNAYGGSNDIAALMDGLEDDCEDELNIRTGLWTPPR